MLNPPSGWIANTNTSPFAVTVAGQTRAPPISPAISWANRRSSCRSDFCGAPSSISPHDLPELKERLAASHQILSRSRSFTFEDWTAAVTNRWALRAEVELPGLLAEWRALTEADPARAERLRAVV